MTTLDQAKTSLAREVVRSIREGDSFNVQEADDSVNSASLDLIACMADLYGECWLGHINLSRDRSDEHDEDYEPPHPRTPMWKWSGKPVYNFGASFVCPRYDAELERMILERDAAPYTGTADDSVRVTAIFDHIEAIGGSPLLWG